MARDQHRLAAIVSAYRRDDRGTLVTLKGCRRRETVPA